VGVVTEEAEAEAEAVVAEAVVAEAEAVVAEIVVGSISSLNTIMITYC